MARKKRWFLWFFLFFVALVAGIALWAWNTDLGRFEPQIEKFASHELGRQLEFGELHIHLGETVEISVRDLRLANPPWADAADLLQVASLDLSLPFSSLFESPLVLDRVDIDGVTVSAEHSEEHGMSWDLPKADAKPSTAEPGTGLPLLVHELNLSGMSLYLERPSGLPPLRIAIDELAQVHRADDMLDLRASGKLNDYDAEYVGELGTMEALLSRRDVRFQGNARLGSLVVEGRAEIDDLLNPHRPGFELEFSGPDIADVAEMLGLPPPPPGPFRLAGTARAEADHLRLTLDARAGENYVKLDGRSEGLLDLSRVDYALDASGTNLGAFTLFFNLGQWPKEPFTARGRVTRDGRLLELIDVDVMIGGATFGIDGTLNNFPDFNNAKLNFDLRGDDAEKFRNLVGVRGVAVGPFSASGSLQARPDGRDEFSVNLRTAIGEASAKGSLGSGPGYLGSTAQLRVDGRDARELFDGYGIPGFPAEPFSLDASFEVEEKGLRFERAVLATLGEDRVEVGGFVGFEPGAAGTEIRIRARGSDLARFAPISGFDLPIATQPYEIDSGFRITADGYRIDGLTGRVGPNDIGFDGLVSRNPGLSGSDFTFGLKGPDLETLLRDTAGWDVPARNFSVSGHLRQLGESIRLDDLALSIGALKGNATLELPKPYDGSEFRLGSDLNGPDIKTIVPEIAGLNLESNAFESAGRIARNGGEWNFEQTRVVLGDARLDVDGVVTLGGDLGHGDLQLALAIPDLKRLGTYNEVPAEELPVSAEFRLTGSNRQIRLEPLRAQLGPTDLQGQLAYSTAGDVPFIEFVTRSRRIDLPDLRQRLRGEKPAEETAREPPEDVRVIPDYVFPLEQLRALNATVDIAADEFPGRLDIGRNLDLKGSLRDGALRIEHLHVEGFEGSITANGALVPDARGSADLRLNFGIDGLVLELSLDEEVDLSTLPTVNLEATLSGNGPDLRAWAASLDGHLRADSGPGVIPNSALAFFDAGLLEQVFTSILPVPKQRTDTQLECFATRLEIENGVVRAAPGVAIMTSKVQIISKGEIDLRTEGLSLDFETQPKKAFQANISEILVNPFVKISGTLAAPAVTLDAPKTALAIGTGGVSILAKGLLNRITKSSDPCGEFMKNSD